MKSPKIKLSLSFEEKSISANEKQMLFYANDVTHVP